jgi:hypothetical protein
VGDQIYDLDLYDLVRVPPLTWHQFRATTDEPLGFLCLVNCERDRPMLPTAADLQQLRQLPQVEEFIQQ